jgi:sugar/nucleoside kinase (ribokinase family)
MPKDDIIAIGEAFEDQIFIDLPHVPAPGEEIKTDRFVKTIGGGVVITAIAAARLQLRCRVISGLSPLAVRRLKSESVNVRNLRKPDEPYAISVALSTREDRSFVTYNGINSILEERLIEPARRARSSHVHLAFCPGNCGQWVDVVQTLHLRGVTTSWDFGWNECLLEDHHFPELLESVNYLFINEQEAVLYSGQATLAEAEKYWQQQSQNTILKLGSKGSLWLSPECKISAGPIEVAALDTTGAGDAFNGGFLTGVIRKKNTQTMPGSW